MNTILRIVSRLLGVKERPKKEKGKECCPKCGGQDFIMGPEGGGSVNVQCNGCFTYYNFMGPFGFHEIGDRSSVFGKKKPL